MIAGSLVIIAVLLLGASAPVRIARDPFSIFANSREWSVGTRTLTTRTQARRSRQNACGVPSWERTVISRLFHSAHRRAETASEGMRVPPRGVLSVFGSLTASREHVADSDGGGDGARSRGMSQS
jgi:hypothetical protein